MVRINWTFQAKDDLKDIAEYISKDSKLSGMQNFRLPDLKLGQEY